MCGKLLNHYNGPPPYLKALVPEQWYPMKIVQTGFEISGYCSAPGREDRMFYRSSE